MKSDLLRRLERMEQRTSPREAITIFVNMVSPGSIDKVVAGWSFRCESELVEVRRKEGESDEDLKHRAEGTARKYLGASCALLLISLA